HARRPAVLRPLRRGRRHGACGRSVPADDRPGRRAPGRPAEPCLRACRWRRDVLACEPDPFAGAFAMTATSSSALASPFVDGLARHELRFQRCTACGTAQTLARYACAHCGNESLAWET